MMSEASESNKLTFRRFKSGETMWKWDDLTKKIFQADRTYKCPTYVHRTPPCQGSCPSGHDIRGWLAIARGMDKPPARNVKWQEYAFEDGRGQSVSRDDGPRVPCPLRRRLQPQRGR